MFTKGAFRGAGAWKNVLMAALIILLPGSVLCSEAGLLQGVSFDRVFWKAARWAGYLLRLAVLLLAWSRYRATRIPLFQWLAWAAGLGLVVTLYHMVIEAVFPLPYPPASLPSQPEWLPYAQIIPLLVTILIVPLLYVLAVESLPDRRLWTQVFGRPPLIVPVLAAMAILVGAVVYSGANPESPRVAEFFVSFPTIILTLIMAYAVLRAYRRYQELGLPLLKWLAVALAIPLFANAFSFTIVIAVVLTMPFRWLVVVSNLFSMIGIQLLFPALLVYAMVSYRTPGGSFAPAPSAE